MNLLAHTTETLREVWLLAQLASGAQTLSFSLSQLCFLLRRLHSQASSTFMAEVRRLPVGSTGLHLHTSKSRRKIKPLFPVIPLKVLELSLFRSAWITCPSLKSCGWDGLMLSFSRSESQSRAGMIYSTHGIKYGTGRGGVLLKEYGGIKRRGNRCWESKHHISLLNII